MVLEPWALEGLDGIVPGDELIVLTWLDRGDRDAAPGAPARRRAQPLRGVYGTRSADRPNPIGLHRVEVVAVEGNRLGVRNLEAVDATPVVDMKPVLARGE